MRWFVGGFGVSFPSLLLLFLLLLLSLCLRMPVLSSCCAFIPSLPTLRLSVLRVAAPECPGAVVPPALQWRMSGPDALWLEAPPPPLRPSLQQQPAHARARDLLPNVPARYWWRMRTRASMRAYTCARERVNESALTGEWVIQQEHHPAAPPLLLNSWLPRPPCAAADTKHTAYLFQPRATEHVRIVWLRGSARLIFFQPRDADDSRHIVELQSDEFVAKMWCSLIFNSWTAFDASLTSFCDIPKLQQVRLYIFFNLASPSQSLVLYWFLSPRKCLFLYGILP